MTCRRYIWTVLMPAFLMCWMIGKPAAKIERSARRVKLKYLNKLRAAMAARPEVPPC